MADQFVTPPNTRMMPIPRAPKKKRRIIYPSEILNDDEMESLNDLLGRWVMQSQARRNADYDPQGVLSPPEESRIASMFRPDGRHDYTMEHFIQQRNHDFIMRQAIKRKNRGPFLPLMEMLWIERQLALGIESQQKKKPEISLEDQLESKKKRKELLGKFKEHAKFGEETFFLCCTSSIYEGNYMVG